MPAVRSLAIARHAQQAPGSDGSRLISGRDAFAWPEVYFEDLGWVPFSPTPNDDTFRRDRPEEGEAPGQEESTAPSVAPTATPTGPAATPTPAPDPGAGTASTSAPPWLPYALVVAAAAGVALLLALARWARRLRHRRRGATGAWSEVLDALRLSGIPAPQHESAEQLALDVDRRLGIQATTQVATVAERAAFGPGPAPAGPLGQQMRTVRRSARRTTPRWRRWWWHLDPRVFVR